MYGKLLNTLPLPNFQRSWTTRSIGCFSISTPTSRPWSSKSSRAARQTGGGRADDGGQHLLYRRQLRGQGVRDQDWHARGRCQKMCPGLLLVEATHAFYVRYHHMIVDVVESCVPVAAGHFDRSNDLPVTGTQDSTTSTIMWW